MYCSLLFGMNSTFFDIKILTLFLFWEVFPLYLFWNVPDCLIFLHSKHYTYLFWLHWVFIVTGEFSLISESEGYFTMALHSSTPAWKILWTEEPGRLQSMGLLRVRHDWATSLSLFTFMHWRRKWQPTPVFLPGESQGGGAWWAAVYGVAQSQTRLKQLSSSSSL